MRIVLAEIRGEQKLASREFKQTNIKIGREELRCNLVFEATEWPMVSRIHAELRIEGDRCYLTDSGSTHGTFLNGERIWAATEVQTGARIQFGPKGPVLSVELIADQAVVPGLSTMVDFDAAKRQAALRAQAAKHPQSEPPPVPATAIEPPPVPKSTALQDPPAAGRPSQAKAETPPAETSPKFSPFLLCESGAPGQLGRKFVLTNDKTLLGRDAAAAISMDAAAAAVSRRHAEIRRQADGSFVIVDLNSFNGTLVNRQRIAQPVPLHNGDRVQLGASGPILCFVDPFQASAPMPKGVQPPVAAAGDSAALLRTIVFRPGAEHPAKPGADAHEAQFLFQRSFDDRQKLSVGRGADNDIQLDGLLISKHHARFIITPQGIQVEDAGSTNGVYLNGGRVSARQPVQNQDVVQIGPFVFRADGATGIAVFDTRSKTRIDAIGVTETVPKPSGRGSRKLLDDISLSIAPNEFVGVLGPSGAGKSMLVNALNGTRKTSGGRVLINNLELYQHVDSLKQSIGYVPQDDIIHRQLTVYRTLYYVARLRLSRDVRKNEIDQIIGEVLEVTGLSDRRDVVVAKLSGGQRKRVSIAVELITKPSLIFLDEPTSGLDPATEERIMRLFRQIAESGRTVILTTHAMENVRLFDKVVLLMRGKLIFYGTPEEVLEFVGADNFVDLYNKIEGPLEAQTARLTPPAAKATKAEQRTYEDAREEIVEAVAADWQGRFLATESYRRYVWEPLSQVQQEAQTAAPPRRRRSILDAWRQWATLVRRYSEVLASDKWNLLILFGQAPIIGLLTYLVVGKNDPRDFPYFILALVSIWFGTSVAARELVKEQPIFRRERMVNLRLLPYVASKLIILSLIVGLQATLLFGTLKVLHFADVMYLPGLFLGLPQLLVMTLTGIVGIALGLFISAVVKSSEMATSLVPLILIPQILFAGLTGVPTGVAKVVGAAMPATWSFDEMKRLSTLDTLREEGANPHGPNKGHGLYQHLRDLNAQNIKDARAQVEDYNKRTSEAFKEHERQLAEYLRAANSGATTVRPPEPLAIGSPPPIPEPQGISDDLSGYVNFMHPWGNIALNAAVLCVMLWGLIVATMIALRLKDR